MSESLRRLIILAKERGASHEQIEEMKRGLTACANTLAIDIDYVAQAFYAMLTSGWCNPVVDLRTSPLRLVRDE